MGFTGIPKGDAPPTKNRQIRLPVFFTPAQRRLFGAGDVLILQDDVVGAAFHNAGGRDQGKAGLLLDFIYADGETAEQEDS